VGEKVSKRLTCFDSINTREDGGVGRERNGGMGREIGESRDSA